MFRKIQSYVTPILLSYVDKYIKDFKTEDTQVSLWGGSVSLHNLELRPDIIQQEFNLPFSLSSGHIHELLIQVPWMKIVSEPIIITINTIECILKLADGQQTHSDPSKSSKDGDELDAPPGYVQSLVNRIVSNIAFRCNNIILKYVEEDIVVSVNIKQFNLDNVDGEWVPTFTEMTMEDLHTRKLVKLSDITLCLDKRNAAGKIETYLEPLLYKCELELRLDSTYLGISNKRPANTRISVNSPKLEFSFSYQQIPMIIRITALFLALKKKKLNIPEDFDSPSDGTQHMSPKTSKEVRHRDEVNYEESWSGWMLSFVQPFPLGYGEEQDTSLNQRPITLFGINFDSVTFSFKVPDILQDTSGIYNQRKFRYHNICTWKLNKVICEISSHGFERFCFRGGIEYIELYPENLCPCGISDTDTQQESKKKYYFKSTGVKKDENISFPIEFDSQTIVDTMEEETMLAICPAFAFSYIYELSIPEESKNTINSIEPDLEYSNFKEETTMTFIFGPFEMFLCAGMIHRFSLIKIAADAYDYASYYTSKSPIKLSELPPPTTDDYDTLSEFVPKINMKITAVNCKINIAVWDHYVSIKSPILNDFSMAAPILNRKKISISSSENAITYYEKLKNMPSILVQIEKLTGSITNPMYPDRLTYVTCQLPEAPAIMLDSCYKYTNLNVDNMQCFIVNLSKKEKKKSSNLPPSDKIAYDVSDTKVHIPIITDCSFHVSMKHLLLREYWTKHKSILHDDYNFNMNNMTACVSMAKTLAAYHICLATLPQQDIIQKSAIPEKASVSFSKNHIILMQSSLLKDASDHKTVHLDVNFEGLSLRSIFLSDAHTHRMVLNTIKVFAIGVPKDPSDKLIQRQVWIISAPENNNQHSMPLVKTVMQFSSDAQYSSFFTMKIEEWSFIMDPLFFQWLTYSYQPQNESSSILAIPASESGHAHIQKRQSRRSLDEIVNRIGGSSRTLNRLSLGQSSSDREKDYVHGVPNTAQQSGCSNLKEDAALKEEPKEESMFIHNLVKKYFEHKNMAIFLEIEPILLYFPVDSVSGLSYGSISEAIQDSVIESKNEDKILVLRLPSLLLKSSTLKQNLLSFCVYGLPVKLPGEIWDQTKNSYPWTVSMKNLNCSTLSCKLSKEFPQGCVVETNILKQFSSDLTISFTPKLQKKTEINVEKSKASGNSDSNSKNASTNNPEHQSPDKYTEVEFTEKPLKIEISENTNKPKSKGFTYLKNKFDNLGDFKHLSSIGICIHIDTELVSVSINENQMILLNSIIHVVKELSNVMLNIHKSDNYSGKIKKLSSNPLGSHNPNCYNTRQRNLSTSDNIITDHLLEDLSKDSDARDNSCAKIDDKDEDNKKYLNVPHDSLFNINVWIQWTISRASLKAYAFLDKTKNESNRKKSSLKLVFAADDIVSSLDVQHEYLKWNMKVVTAGVHHYKRNDTNEPWKLGDFCGIILKGKEFIKHAKSSGENSFLLINVTRARCSSVHNKWGDICKTKSKTMLSSDDTYISEIEISLQALDIILNLKSLEPFTYILSFCNHTVNCQTDQLDNEMCTNIADKSPANTVAQSWDSRKMALCYFEGHHMRIIMPVVAFCDEVRTDNVLILQTDRILLLPIADNPVCRSPLRPDLYQQAARTGYLNLPGSELEDRQCQLTLKGISLYTTQWHSIENSYKLELNSQPIISENPALQWNDTFPKQCSAIPTMNIVEKVDICLMLALSIYHQFELVCGPTIDISIDSDVEICLSIPQYLLIKTLMDEFLSVIQTSRRQFNNLLAGPELESCDSNKSLISICPYRKFINKNSLKYCYESIDVETERATPTLSVDTGIASDMMSSFTETSKSSPKFTGKNFKDSKYNENKIPTVQADYFDIFVTFGKIGFNLFEIVSPQDMALSNENILVKEDKDDRGTSVFFSKPLLYVTFHQPNFSYSNNNFIIKSQFSIFHVSISLGDECIHKGLPKINDFLIDLFETKPGIPDANSGISPAFLTTKLEKNVGKKNSMKIYIKCPIRLTLSLDRLLKLDKITRLLIKSTQFDNSPRNFPTSTKLEDPSSTESIKSIFATYSSIELSTSQIVFAVVVQDQIDFEILLSLLSYKHTITFNSRREEITNLGIIDSLSLSLRKTDDRQTKILVNPWTVGFQFIIGWKIWHYSSVSPIIKIFVTTDRLLVDLSSEHIKILSSVSRYWNENWKTLFKDQNVLNANNTEPKNPSDCMWIWNSTINNQSNEQHYKDDLRAGAFKFIYGGVGYPLAYQVYIGSNNIVWCYPQPRAITRVHSFPIPFKIMDNASNSTLKESVPCTLEYFSEVTHTFNYYAKFYIKQDERLKLDLSQQ